MSKSKNSLVAYFDILGYQSFLKNNSALDTAEKIFRLVKEAPKEAFAKYGNSDLTKLSDGGNEWKKVTDSLQPLVFSDTIVVSCPIHEVGPDARHTAIIAGVSASIALNMFKNGLPVKGAITFGSFIFDETCIAGRAIVEAHTLCQSLDVAGVALSPKLSEFMDKIFTNDKEDFWDIINPYYLFPLKDGSELKTRAVCWGFAEEKGDFTSKVREAFWQWNKDIPLSVDSKVNNTAKMLDFFRMVTPKAEQRLASLLESQKLKNK
jgi:hypothetical protein